MVWQPKIVFLFALFAWPSAPVRSQEQSPAPDANYEIVSGTVTDLPAGRIVVNRAVLGKPPEERTFLITGQTKVEGRLRVNARVTVGFRPSDEGDIAMRIIVRSQPNPRKP
jgi:hypothetical protein